MSAPASMSDAEFLAAFESGALPRTLWDHRAHLRVAFLYLSRWDLASAIDRMRRGIQSYNAAGQIADGPETGYHETTTQAFMRLIHGALQQRGPFQDSQQFCEQNPELLDRRVLLCYYTRDRIMAPEAKRDFVAPDLAALDRIGCIFPQFGQPLPDVEYELRPGGYGVLADGMGRVAVVATPQGMFLPGGGQEPGESAIDALKREALEECGLTVRVRWPIGVADEFIYCREERRHYCKRGTFYAAGIAACGPAAEPDHQLIRLGPSKVLKQLSQKSHRWAVTQMQRRLAAWGK